MSASAKFARLVCSKQSLINGDCVQPTHSPSHYPPRRDSSHRSKTLHRAVGKGRGLYVWLEMRNYLRRVCTHKQEIGFGRAAIICVVVWTVPIGQVFTDAGIKGVYFARRAKGLHLHRELCVDTRTHSRGLTSWHCASGGPKARWTVNARKRPRTKENAHNTIEYIQMRRRRTRRKIWNCPVTIGVKLCESLCRVNELNANLWLEYFSCACKYIKLTAKNLQHYSPFFFKELKYFASFCSTILTMNMISWNDSLNNFHFCSQLSLNFEKGIISDIWLDNCLFWYSSNKKHRI
jgi:hypothetical protein